METIIECVVLACYIALSVWADCRGTKAERRAREDRMYYMYHV